MKKVTIARSDKDGLFSYVHKCSEHPQFVEFNLHTHIDYEIVYDYRRYHDDD